MAKRRKKRSGRYFERSTLEENRKTSAKRSRSPAEEEEERGRKKSKVVDSGDLTPEVTPKRPRSPAEEEDERGRKKSKVMDSGDLTPEVTPKRPRSPENEGEPCLRKRAKMSSSEKRGTKRSRTSDGEEEQNRRKRIKISSCENRGMKRSRTPDSDGEESSAALSSSESHVSKRCRISDSEEEQCRQDSEVTAPENQGELYVPALPPRKPLGQSLADYTFHRMLGQGGFGTSGKSGGHFYHDHRSLSPHFFTSLLRGIVPPFLVMLASLRATNQQVAIKVMEKDQFLNACVCTERNVLQVARGSPFLCHGLAAFQTQEFSYLVLEYVRGGTLDSFMERRGQLTLEEVRNLLAQMICGLQYLHSCGIIHRDLKPENILMSDDGHIKIVDFGLAVENITGDRVARGRIGTAFFLSPEQLSLRSYGASVDWWAMGVIFCIMLTGKYPFDDTGTIEMYEQEVLNTRHRYPSELPKYAEDLLNRLLDKNPETRLGVAGNIREHPFFQSINWEELESCQAVPPCCPSTSQDRQTVTTGERFLFMDDRSSVTESKKISGLSFVAPEWPE